QSLQFRFWPQNSALTVSSLGPANSVLPEAPIGLRFLAACKRHVGSDSAPENSIAEKQAVGISKPCGKLGKTENNPTAYLQDSGSELRKADPTGWCSGNEKETTETGHWSSRKPSRCGVASFGSTAVFEQAIDNAE